MAGRLADVARKIPAALFNLVFPDECRLCQAPLIGVSRIPVCPSCLALPQSHQAEFFCRACRTPFVEAFPLDEHDLCSICRQSMVTFDFAYSFGSFEGSLQQLIHLFKYGKVESLALPLSRMLLRALPREQHFDLVMAMPMHWRKQWDRGFNQAALLAAPVARQFGVRLAGNLRRSRYTRSQAGLSDRQRQSNLKDSFRVVKPHQVQEKRVLLIDDVFTTGATLRAAAEALKGAGVAHVSVLTLARVDRRSNVPVSASRHPQTAAPVLAETGAT